MAYSALVLLCDRFPGFALNDLANLLGQSRELLK